MSPLGILAFIICAIAIFKVSRPTVIVPILAGTCLLTMGEALTIGTLHFPLFRFLILVAHVRLLLRSDWQDLKWNTVDTLMIIFSLWMMLSSFFHRSDGFGFITLSSYVFDVSGVYFIVRATLRSWNDLFPITKALAILLAIVAFEMVYEKATGKNLFSIFGRIQESVVIRGDKLRAQGPFLHPILAGTVGATSVALFATIWRKANYYAKIGTCAGLSMTIASASSGPLIALFFVTLALFFWRFRRFVSLIKWLLLSGYLLAEIVMPGPAYYIMARVDLTGNSDGWHRARLIEVAFSKLGDWWLWGADYTRDWMPSGVPWSANHTDITNYFLHWGVMGGLTPMLSIITVTVLGFKYIGQFMRRSDYNSNDNTFKAWCLGACLTGHVVTCFSVAYFDQSLVFIWLTIGCAASIPSFASEDIDSDSYSQTSEETDLPETNESI